MDEQHDSLKNERSANKMGRLNSNNASAYVASALLTSLAEILFFYPGSLDLFEAKEHYDDLVSYFNHAIESLDLEKSRVLLAPIPNFKEMGQGSEFEVNAIVFLCQQLGNQIIDTTKEENEELFKKFKSECGELVPEPLKQIGLRLTDVEFWDCRIPMPCGDLTFKDPRRYLHLLEEYWSIAASIITNQLSFLFRLGPNPINGLMIGLQDRISLCLQGLTEFEHTPEIQKTISELIDLFIYFDVDDFQDKASWIINNLHRIEVCLSQSRLRIGSVKVTYTKQEAIFMERARSSVEEYISRMTNYSEDIFPDTQSDHNRKLDSNACSQKDMIEGNIDNKLTKQQFADNKAHGYLYTERIHIYGYDVKEQRNRITINKQDVQIQDANLRLFVRLVVELKKGGGGWLHKQELLYEHAIQVDGYQPFDNLRRALPGVESGAKFIQNRRGGNYRISNHPDFITYDKNNLLKHNDPDIARFASHLPD